MKLKRNKSDIPFASRFPGHTKEPIWKLLEDFQDSAVVRRMPIKGRRVKPILNDRFEIEDNFSFDD